MAYRQLSMEERRILIYQRRRGVSQAEIARLLGRHRSTITRELQRNLHHNKKLYYYTFTKAHQKAIARRSRSRRNTQFTDDDWKMVDERIRMDWSPEQVSETLKMDGTLSISHESIYRHIIADKKQGGDLYRHLRLRPRKRRKRYGSRENRGKLQGKRMISERPLSVEQRKELGHWEIDTVLGRGDKNAVLTMVERATGYVQIHKIKARTVEQVNMATINIINKQPNKVISITADNGTEFHGYRDIEKATGSIFYFAHPHHAWERGTNENTNGLIRQYLPKRSSMRNISQRQCDQIADTLNSRPRKRYNYITPKEKYEFD
jgi:transposase, IS30 family